MTQPRLSVCPFPLNSSPPSCHVSPAFPEGVCTPCLHVLIVAVSPRAIACLSLLSGPVSGLIPCDCSVAVGFLRTPLLL